MSAGAVVDAAYALLARRADDADREHRAAGVESKFRADLDASLGIEREVVEELTLVQLAERLGVPT